MLPEDFKEFKIPHRPADESEDWMVSFADMVTLLLCFFIIYFNDRSDTEKITILEEIAAVFSSENSKPFLSGTEKGAKVQSVAKDMLPKLEKDLRESLARQIGGPLKVGLKRAPKGLTIRIWEKGMFQIGSWKLSRGGKKLLKEIASTLNPFRGQILIFIEGHTDTAKPSRFSAYKNNLALSGLRAVSAANLIIDAGFTEKNLFVQGFGASQPLVVDRTLAGEYSPELGNLNRRIQLRLIPKDKISKMFGGGTQ